MIAPAILNLRHVLQRFLRSRIISVGTAEQYTVTVDLIRDWHGCDLPLSRLSEDTVADWLRWYFALPRSPETVRRKRGHLITLWRFASDEGLHREPVLRRIPNPKKLKRIPTSWHPQEMTAILAACKRSEYPKRSAWGPLNWVALVRTLFDTSHRIGAIVETRMPQLNVRTGELILTAEQTKQSSDIAHTLKQSTVGAIKRSGVLAGEMMFPWPCHLNYLRECFKRILKDAGLPAGRRDLFHRIRRTSYTQVAIRCGKSVAGEHAGHSSDMSAYYFDTSKLDRVNPVDSLPDI